jgi:hypothetical protein
MLHWITLKIVPPRGPRLLFLVIFPHPERERQQKVECGPD